MRWAPIAGALLAALSAGAALVGTARAERTEEGARIARLVRDFPALRERSSAGLWRPVEPWSISDADECLAALDAQGIDFRRVPAPHGPVIHPVEITGPIAGVRYRKRRTSRPFIVSCELATRMPALSQVLQGEGVREVEVLSSWRRAPGTSFHTMGLALDLYGFQGEGFRWTVERDFSDRRDAATCPLPEAADPIHRIACALWDSRRFSTVITPRYSPGHHDHLHVDLRPEDPRGFLR